MMQWADLAGAHFEGALLASSDIARICANPTLDEETRLYEVGTSWNAILGLVPA